MCSKLFKKNPELAEINAGIRHKTMTEIDAPSQMRENQTESSDTLLIRLITMPLITIFSAPKPFSDPHIAIIQRNAISSWTKLPDVEVICLGDEPGLAEIAAELGVKHIREIPRSPSGAPLMDAMFRLAREASPTPLYCIVNADIILFDDLVEAAKKVSAQKEKFVLLGQRWDLEITTPLDFSEDWQDRLRSIVHSQGALHRPAGSDYFSVPQFLLYRTSRLSSLAAPVGTTG